MFVLITSEMGETDFSFNDAELYETLEAARQWVEISQGYDLEAGDLRQYTIYDATPVAIDSEQTDGLFVRTDAEMLVYDSFEEIVELVNHQLETEKYMYAENVEMVGAELAAKWEAEKEPIVIYRLADEPIQVITEVIDEDLIAA